jgi:hypothetical protein
VLTFLFAPRASDGVRPAWPRWASGSLHHGQRAGGAGFRFDLFFFFGALATLAAGFVFGPVSGRFVAEALLLAFAVEFPDYEVLLLILPVKVKYLGILGGGLMVYALVTGDLATRAAVAVALGDFLLFCGSTLRSGCAGPAWRGAVAPRSSARPEDALCACGKDADDPNPSSGLRLPGEVPGR